MRVAVRVPDRGLDVTLDVSPGQVVAVLGENGAGKSTLLAAVAGLVPGEGEVRVDGVDVTRAPPRDRHVGWVAQRPLLLEHLAVLDDVAFGPRSRGASRRRSRDRAAVALDRVGAGHLAGRRGHALSGGQAQRVALARALATDPRVLLLDEPFAALDVGVAAHARTLLLGLARAEPRTTLLVTHDLLDVLVLADRVVVLADGRVVEDGPVAEVLARPRSAFAARLAGVHLVTGTVVASPDGHARGGAAGRAAGGAAGEEHEVTVDTGAGLVLVGTSTEPLAVGEPAAAVVEPRAVAVHTTHPSGSPRNVVPVRLTGVEPSGALVRVRGTAAGGVVLAADLTPRAVAALGLTPGTEAWFTVKAAELAVHARPAAPAPGATLVG
nr:ABC transporter ATP-binding protein [Cellulomonas sp. SLBN-39]